MLSLGEKIMIMVFLQLLAHHFLDVIDRSPSYAFLMQQAFTVLSSQLIHHLYKRTKSDCRMELAQVRWSDKGVLSSLEFIIGFLQPWLMVATVWCGF